MDRIFEAIEEWMRNLLTGMVSSNLTTMYTERHSRCLLSNHCFFSVSIYVLRSLFRLCPYGRPFMISQIHHLPIRAKKKSYVSESFTCSASLFSVFNSSARLSSEKAYRSNSCVLVSFTSIRCRIYASTSNSFFLS